MTHGVNATELPGDVDTNIPSPARIYDCFLGGVTNYAIDREAAKKALSAVPCGEKVAWANRRFLVRAVKHFARKGIWQFIDLGTGIPTSPNVHEAAWSINPGARVVYVDNDPTVIAHSKKLLSGQHEAITVIRGDIRAPSNILTDPALRAGIDFSRPVGVLFVAVLHFITNAQNPYQAVKALKERIPPGSYLAISHITSDGTDPGVISTIQEAYAKASAPAVFRTRDEIAGFFTGFELVRPGLVEVSDWRGNHKPPASPPALRFLGGVARKP
jgi:O-methyltransferase involved in polyketide biosynthesis